MSIKAKDESFPDFVARVLAPHMRLDRSKVFDVLIYLIRSGSVVCVLDAIDEAVSEVSPAGILAMFADIADVLSAESVVVMSSRIPFLDDSPQTRQLMGHAAATSEKLTQQLYASGVDPQRLPRFGVLRLADVTDTSPAGATISGSPLELSLAHALGGGDAIAAGSTEPLADLLWRNLTGVVRSAGLGDLLPVMVDFFGAELLRGNTVFTVTALYNALGSDAFDRGRLDLAAFRLAGLFRAAGGEALAFAHSAYQELLGARFLAGEDHRETAVGMERRAFLTEQLRSFLYHVAGPAGTRSDDCVLTTGVYLVGPSSRLLLRRIPRAVVFDRYPVTVARYRRFLDAIAPRGSQEWDHPAMPDNVSHQPWTERLRIQDYYTDPRYDDHPAICISWWSAYAFARFEGKRLPNALEWEAAARGPDGRLFPWGDEVVLSAVNCADSWSDRPLITYEVWKAELDRGALRASMPVRVDSHPDNISPFGVREMSGNVWEWTETVFEDLNEAVICGGSYDNPYRAVQASAKGLFRRRGCSNVVGFRCVTEMP